MKTYLLNPTLEGQELYIREGRCMQKASSWASAWPPISMALLATMARAWGEAKLVDGNVEKISLQDLFNDLKTFQPDWVVINTGFPSIDSDMGVAKEIKQAFPNILVMAFGVYFTMLEKEGFANYPFLDLAMMGEPEITFQELGTLLAQGKKSFSSVKGLLYKTDQGIAQNPDRPFLDNLDQLPHADRSFLKNDCYRLPQNNHVYTLINTARGCPYQCIYCIVQTYYGNKIRKHSIPYVMEELKECIERFGLREFLFWEEVFSLDKKYLLDLCQAITDAKLNISWAATTRVGTIDDEVVLAMKKAGCYLIGLGIETSSQDILDRAKKKQTVEDVKRAVAVCKRHKLSTMGHFIFGLPGETKKTAEATIRFMVGLGLDYMQSYCAVPYPKTELGALAKSKNWIHARQWSQYDFGGKSIMSTDTLTCGEVDNFRSKAFRRFYFRPFFVMKKLFTDLSILQMLRIANFGDWMNLLGFRRKGSK
jgi:radical SAM superfamily enzyme YgiQ (UPF0313 family)